MNEKLFETVIVAYIIVCSRSFINFLNEESIEKIDFLYPLIPKWKWHWHPFQHFVVWLKRIPAILYPKKNILLSPSTNQFCMVWIVFQWKFIHRSNLWQFLRLRLSRNMGFCRSGKTDTSDNRSLPQSFSSSIGGQNVFSCENHNCLLIQKNPKDLLF